MLDIAGEFLTVFEKHFGQRWSKVLSGFIAVAIAAGSIELVIQLLKEIYHQVLYLTGNHSLYNLLKNDLVSVIYTTLLSLSLYFIFATVIKHRFDVQFDKSMKEAMRVREEVTKYSKKTMDQWKSEGENVKALMDGVNIKIEEIDANYAKMKNLADLTIKLIEEAKQNKDK